MVQFLTPELTSSGLGFKDLHLTKHQQIRKRFVKCNLAFSLLDIKAVSNPAPLDVIGRVVRMALFDKSNIVSNIHSVSAYLHADNENCWRFAPASKVCFHKAKINFIDIIAFPN